MAAYNDSEFDEVLGDNGDIDFTRLRLYAQDKAEYFKKEIAIVNLLLRYIGNAGNASRVKAITLLRDMVSGLGDFHSNTGSSVFSNDIFQKLNEQVENALLHNIELRDWIITNQIAIVDGDEKPWKSILNNTLRGLLNPNK